MIILDSTEARNNTRLPQAVINAAQIIVGFELLTGADILISPLSEPALPDKLIDCRPHVRMLMRHTRAGILVQRKDGLDLLSSIPNLCNVQKRMMDWCGNIGPWLLSIGQFIQRQDGRLIVNREEVLSSFDLKSIKAALDWWQLRGGGVTELCSARYITAWVNHWHSSMLHKLDSEPDKLVIEHPPAQALKSSDNAWWAPLAVIPGIGSIKAQVLAEWLPEHRRSLAHAICYLCDDRNAGLDRPPGFGPKTFESTRDLFGLTNTDIIRIISVGESELSHYPVVITWPAEVNAATVNGQWWKREDGRTEAVYNSQDELRVCLETMGVIQ